jgi:hypothetical protein
MRGGLVLAALFGLVIVCAEAHTNQDAEVHELGSTAGVAKVESAADFMRKIQSKKRATNKEKAGLVRHEMHDVTQKSSGGDVPAGPDWPLPPYAKQIPVIRSSTGKPKGRVSCMKNGKCNPKECLCRKGQPPKPFAWARTIHGDDETDLGESETISAASVHLHGLSAADQAALNLEAAQAYPKSAAKIKHLRKRLLPLQHKVQQLAVARVRAHAAVHAREKLVDKMEQRHEFNLMTDPHAEEKQLAAEARLKKLQDTESSLKFRFLNTAKTRAGLGAKLKEQEDLQRVQEKALLLFHKYKKRDLAHKAMHRNVQSKFRSKFQAASLKAAESAAKKKYHQYVQREHARSKLRQVARAKMRMKRRALRRKSEALAEAKREADDEVRVRAQAEAMFKEFKSRFLEEQQESRAMSSESQDLGESADVESSTPASSHGKLSMVESTLDQIQASVHKLPSAPPATQKKVFGLDE